MTNKGGNPNGKHGTAAWQGSASLDAVLRNLPALIFRLQVLPEPIFQYLSPALEKLLGYRQQELAGKPDSLQRLLHPEDQAELLQLPHAPAVGPRSLRFIHASGRTVWMEVSSTSVSTEDGQSKWIDAVARELGDSPQPLSKTPLQQAEKLEVVGRLAAGIAHDFNNLLHVIQGHTQIMQSLSIEELGDGSNLYDMLAEVDRASTRAAGLVKQLLYFGRSEISDRKPVRVDDILHALHGVLRGVLGPNIQLVMQCNTVPAIVEGNAAELEQVITNLCVNAREACSAGGFITVSLDSIPVHEVPITARPSASAVDATHRDTVRRNSVRNNNATHYLRLTFQDDGKGMSKAVQERLFEPFFTTKATGEGSGLGLATAYAIVQAHQGHIESSSVVGEGSIFRVYLPQMDLEGLAQASEPPSSPSDIIEGNQRLAIVAEDEPAVLALTASYLRQAGFRVVTATNGPAAEQLLEEHGQSIEIAVLDAVMPGFGAEGVSRAMSQRKLSTPVLYMTGYQEAQLPSRSGAQQIAILRKPFGPNELLAAVGKLLEPR